MKIGIFGDSFAILKLNPTPTWVEILSEKYDITNYAFTGSNLYYSVSEIKKHHENYDKIILVVTEPSRIKVAKWVPIDIGKQFIIKGIDKNFLDKDNLTKYEKLVWEASNQYFTYLQDTEYDRYIQGLMLNDLIKLRSDIILIPAFLNSWYNVNGASMANIFHKENTAWGLDAISIVEQYNDSRNCHMTAENNSIFADKADTWINGEPVHINLDDFVTTTNKDFYLTKIL